MSTPNIIMIIMAAIVVAYCIVIIFLRSRGDNALNYDERQMSARSSAYRYAFLSSLFYWSISEGISIYLDRSWVDHTTNLLLGLCIPILVFAVTCIFKDAYVGVNQDPKSVWIPLFIIGISNIGFGFYSLYNLNGHIVIHNYLSIPVNLICGTTITLTAVLIAIKYSLEQER